MADKADGADAVLEMITGIGAKALVPLKSNRRQQREFDADKYKNRNLVKRFFCRIKHFRRIATRYGKVASRYSAFVALAASFIWLA